MNGGLRTISLTWVGLMPVCLALAQPAAAQDFPPQLSIGTNPVGSLFYAAGGSLVKVLYNADESMPRAFRPFAPSSGCAWPRTT
jgi:hypothetical protein